ncbi:MAG TPA: family 1 glycosylhydrolase [Chloroflexota bacterium]|jgi:beta-glucosidase
MRSVARDRRFRDDFVFGASVAAHQVEGGNVNSDWWVWEHQAGTRCAEPSGDACDFYHRYRDDVRLLAELGLQAFRFSIEWARIEPAPGEFSLAALDHYRRVLTTCHEYRITPVVTFQHFTLPRWVQDAGGIESEDFPGLFSRYCDRASESLGDLIGWACTINEPEVLVVMGYMTGGHPPGRRYAWDDAARVGATLVEAHNAGAAAIRSHCQVPVGATLALVDIQYEHGAQPGDSIPELLMRVTDQFLENVSGDQFVGVQTYTRAVVGRENGGDPLFISRDSETESATQVGWENYPQALGATVRLIAKKTLGKLPILVTENGIATAFDEKRIRFMEQALTSLHDCIRDGVDVRGYLHWSLLDNFEWNSGYGPKFGLVAVDRTTFERRLKPSARWLGEIARTRTLPAQLP